MTKHPKRPRDLNQLAHTIVGIATGDVTETPPVTAARDPAAVELGKRGGLKGGRARAASLTPERRAEIAQQAAAKRWAKKKRKLALFALVARPGARYLQRMRDAMADSYVEALEAERAKISAERLRLSTQLTGLDGQLAGLDTALRVYRASKQPTAEAPPDNRSATQGEDAARPSEGTVKSYVISLVSGSALDGMASGDVLAEAERQGRPLNKNTVTSLLSALARQGVLEFTNGRYRIPQGMPAANPAAGSPTEPSGEAVEAARKAGGT